MDTSLRQIDLVTRLGSIRYADHAVIDDDDETCSSPWGVRLAAVLNPAGKR